MSRGQALVETAISKEANDRIWDAFRRWGYLQANVDPLGDLEVQRDRARPVEGLGSHGTQPDDKRSRCQHNP